MGSLYRRLLENEGTHEAPDPEEVLEDLERMQDQITDLIQTQTKSIELLPNSPLPFHLSMYVMFASTNVLIAWYMNKNHMNFILETRHAHYVMTVFSLASVVVYKLGRKGCHWKVIRLVEEVHACVALFMAKVAITFMMMRVLVILLVTVGGRTFAKKGAQTMLINIYTHYFTTAMIWMLEPKMKHTIMRLAIIDVLILSQSWILNLGESFSGVFFGSFVSDIILFCLIGFIRTLVQKSKGRNNS